MDGFNYIEDHFETTVEPRILEQYKESERWKACLKAVIDQFQVAEDAAFEIASVLDFRNEQPTGERLDWIVGLVNVRRIPGETDNDLFTRFIGCLGNKTAGTPDNVIYNAAILSRDPKPCYIDEADCTFMVYTGPRNEKAVDDGESFDYENEGEGALTGGADQLYARQVKNLAPAGVLGLVGAAIELADGSLLGDAQGRLILAVADDANVERSMVLVDNNNVPIVTPQNVPIRAVTRGVVVPKVEIELDGQYYDGVRVKDLPDAQNDEGFFVRDSEAGGTVKADAMDQATLDELWDTTEPEPSPNDNNG